MNEISVVDYNAVDHMRERLALLLKTDYYDFVASSRWMPDEIRDRAASSDLKWTPHARSYSGTLRSLATRLRAEAQTIYVTKQAGGLPKDIDLGKLKAAISSAVIKNSTMASLLVSLVDKLKGESDAVGTEVNEDDKKKIKAQGTIWDQMIKQVWADTGILTLMAESMVLDEDLKDPANIASVRGFLDEKDAQATKFIDSVYKSHLFGAEDFADPASVMADKDFVIQNLAKVLVFKKESKNGSSNLKMTAPRSIIGAILSMQAPTSSSTLEVGEAMGTLMSLCNEMDGVKAALLMGQFGSTHMKMAEKMSDAKPISVLAAEAERVQGLYALNIYNALAISVSYAQLVLSTMNNEVVLSEVEKLSPRLTAAFDIRGLVKQFMSLPSSPTFNHLVQDLPVSGTLHYNGIKMPLMMNQVGKDHASWLVAAIGTIRDLVPMLDALSKSTSILDLYKKGATMMQATVPTYSELSYMNDAVPITYLQWGKIKTSAKGVKLTNMQNSIVYDWGINRTGGSALMLHQFRKDTQNNESMPYYTGSLSYDEYVTQTLDNVKTMFETKEGKAAVRIPSGAILRKTHLPTMLLSTRMHEPAYQAMLFDRRLNGFGPASANPFKAMNVMFAVKEAMIAMTRKQMIGDYEIPYENEGTSIYSYDHYDTNAKQIEDSELHSILNVGKMWLKEANLKDSVILKRMAKFHDRTKLVSSAYTRDSFWLTLLSCAYVVPTAHIGSSFSYMLVEPAILSTEAMDKGELHLKVQLRKVPMYAFSKGTELFAMKEMEADMPASIVTMDQMTPQINSKADFRPYEFMLGSFSK